MMNVGLLQRPKIWDDKTNVSLLHIVHFLLLDEYQYVSTAQLRWIDECQFASIRAVVMNKRLSVCFNSADELTKFNVILPYIAHLQWIGEYQFLSKVQLRWIDECLYSSIAQLWWIDVCQYASIAQLQWLYECQYASYSAVAMYRWLSVVMNKRMSVCFI